MRHMWRSLQSQRPAGGLAGKETRMREHKFTVRVNNEEYAELLTVRQWYGIYFADAIRDALHLLYTRILDKGAMPIIVSDGIAYRKRRSH